MLIQAVPVFTPGFCIIQCQITVSEQVFKTGPVLRAASDSYACGKLAGCHILPEHRLKRFPDLFRPALQDIYPADILHKNQKFVAADP